MPLLIKFSFNFLLLILRVFYLETVMIWKYSYILEMLTDALT